ncbi:hypothetical protein FQR65_LT16193 [Abscondita terminalis]|nr:hypothetical protein FQR65_LT16193 [Abscondita terminalis]
MTDQPGPSRMHVDHPRFEKWAEQMLNDSDSDDYYNTKDIVIESDHNTDSEEDESENEGSSDECGHNLPGSGAANMSEYMNTYETKIFEVKGGEIQGSQDRLSSRTCFFTASDVKTAVSLNTISAKTNYLKKHLWQLTSSYSLPSFTYEKKFKPVARKLYAKSFLLPTEKLVEVELYVNKDNPNLACSSDCLLLESGVIKRVIEIKCPKVLENYNPNPLKIDKSKPAVTCTLYCASLQHSNYDSNAIMTLHREVSDSLNLLIKYLSAANQNDNVKKIFDSFQVPKNSTSNDQFR